MNTRVYWSGVRERVIAVEEAERRARGCGPSRYPTFEPVLTLAEIAEVEAQFGVALPDEYRNFLAEVGAGSPGPALELTSLCRIDAKWASIKDKEAWPMSVLGYVAWPEGPFGSGTSADWNSSSDVQGIIRLLSPQHFRRR